MTVKLKGDQRARARRAEKRRCRARMKRVHSPFRPTPGFSPTVHAARVDKRLINWQDYTTVSWIRTLLG